MDSTLSPRSFDRVPLLASVDVWHRREAKPARVRDISVGGLGLKDDDMPLEAGAFTTVRVALPGGDRFTALCKVVRLKPGDVGLEFLDIEPRHKARVMAYVESHRARCA
jgi:hypothetical protein